MVYRHFSTKYPTPFEQKVLTDLQIGFENYDSDLRRNQVQWLTNNVLRLKDRLESCLGILNTQNDDVHEASLNTLTDTTHKRYKLRQRAWDNILMNGNVNLPLFAPRLNWFMKPYEIAKFGKFCRVVVDCHTENSLPRVAMANSVKKHLSDKLIELWPGIYYYYFSTVSPNHFQFIFDKIKHFSDFKVLLVCSSDDGCVKFFDKIKSKDYTIDIATNDSSHSVLTFKSFASLFSYSSDQLQNLVSLISAPFIISNYDNTQNILLKPTTGYMPSGLGETSVFNSCVALLALTALNDMNKETYDISDLTHAYYLVGFRITYVEILEHKHYDFLKTCPVISVDGDYGMTLLGVLLKYSGTCKSGDIVLPKRYNNLTLDEKFCWYQSLLTYAFFKNFYYEPWLVLCPYFQHIDKNRSFYDPELQLLSNPHFSISHDVRRFPTRDQFYGRYDIEDHLIDDFEFMLQSNKLYMRMNHVVVDIIMERDYGFKW